jgi:hypothetical protein
MQAGAFLLSVTNTLVLTNTLAYYGICRLRVRNVFIVQAPGVFVPDKPIQPSLMFVGYLRVEHQKGASRG